MSKGSKRSALSYSDESNSEEISESEFESKKKKSKKSKSSKYSDDECETISSKPRRRTVKESAFERQIRLAMEQSLKEAELKNISKSEELNIPDPIVPPIVQNDNLISEFNEINKETGEKTKSNTECLDLSENNHEKIENEDVLNGNDSEQKEALKSNNVNSVVDLTSPKSRKIKTDFRKSSEKPKKTPKKTSKKCKEPKSENEDFELNENNKVSEDDDDFEFSRKSKKKASPSSKKKNDECNSSKKKKKLKDQEASDSNNIESSESKVTYKNELMPETDLIEKKNCESEKNTNSVRKLLDVYDKPDALTENKSLINKQELEANSPENTKSDDHNLLIKSANKFPFSSSNSIVNEDRQKTSFKSVINTSKLYQNVTSNSSPLGRIEIKGSSPVVRVGLSRNIKLPSLHKNVKPQF